MTCEFSLKTFDDLTSVDLYHILKARSQVFVVEQNCVYQDMDDVDFDCLHLVAHQNAVLVGYCRIIPPEFNKVRPKTAESKALGPMPSIGRVLIMPEHRGDGLAREIMTQAIKVCRKKYGKKPIIISAQTYLLSFYESLGFVVDGEGYLEDGIEHVTMILSLAKKAKVKMPSTEQSTVIKVLHGLLILLTTLFIAGLVYLVI